MNVNAPLVQRFSAAVAVADPVKAGALGCCSYRNFDVQRLRAVARTLEPWAGVELADDAVVEVAFASGVSTAERIGLAAGRGIGLGLVRQRVEQAGGRLAVTSIPGKGVAFDITLPLP